MDGKDISKSAGAMRLLEELSSRFKRAGDVEQKLRVLLGPRFVSTDDPYSMDLLDAFARKYSLGASARALVHDTNVFDLSARLDLELHERGLDVDADQPSLETSEPLPQDENERRQLRDDYRAECKAAGVRITDSVLVHAAHPDWNDRNIVGKWIRGKAPYNTKAVDRRFRRVFAEKPHLPKIPTT